MIPGPPALVIITILSPFGSGWCAKAIAKLNKSFIVFALITPVCLKAASYALDDPARVPVWEDTAFAPAIVFPDLTIMIGFFFVTLLQTLINSLPFVTPSR